MAGGGAFPGTSYPKQTYISKKCKGEWAAIFVTMVTNLSARSLLVCIP